LLAITPKCLMCVLAYVGLGAALGFGGPEICGASGGTQAPWASSLALLGAVCGSGAFGILAGWRRVRSAPAENRIGVNSAETQSAPAVDRDADFRQRDIFCTK